MLLQPALPRTATRTSRSRRRLRKPRVMGGSLREGRRRHERRIIPARPRAPPMDTWARPLAEPERELTSIEPAGGAATRTAVVPGEAAGRRFDAVLAELFP